MAGPRALQRCGGIYLVSLLVTHSADGVKGMRRNLMASQRMPQTARSPGVEAPKCIGGGGVVDGVSLHIHVLGTDRVFSDKGEPPLSLHE